MNRFKSVLGRAVPLCPSFLPRLRSTVTFLAVMGCGSNAVHTADGSGGSSGANGGRPGVGGEALGATGGQSGGGRGAVTGGASGRATGGATGAATGGASLPAGGSGGRGGSGAGGSNEYGVAGFARAVTGGGVLPETDPRYFRVTNAVELVAALGSKTVKVIEIMNDLDLGWNELPVAAQAGALRADVAPLLHPALLRSGVSVVDVAAHDGLTIFSARGATIRHAHINIKRSTNLVVRNLRFDELWEWDEASKGDYDKAGWDFITIDMGCKTIWIDHCTFTKAYDGVIDIKGGSADVTLSWNAFVADDGGPSSFVRAQIVALESDHSAAPMYAFLRANGFSVDDIVDVVRSQKKGHLIGALELDAANANHTVTLHHDYYKNMQDRMPRLRAGDAHVYNIFVDNTEARAARLRRDAVVAAMAPAEAAKLTASQPTYHFTVTSNGAISTEGGAVLVEKSKLVDVLSQMRNNQVDATMPQFTGKIRAIDVISVVDGVTFRGGSEDPGSPLAPVPAPAVPFSWNGFSELPYDTVADDPSTLAERLTGPAGAGAGKLSWDKSSWLETSY
jgi:pectate lyase